jgi:GTP-binding protein
MTLPNVVIVGRPNVGKSTLFNRILGRREAIVEERPGVTRDRKDMVAEWQGVEFNLVDTGGWMASGSELEGKVSAKAHGALKGAAAVLFVVDSTVSVTNEDSAVAEFVRKLGVPVFVVANKVDSEAQVFDFFSLGLGEPFAASSLHGLGVADLLDEIVAVLPPPEESSQPEGEAEEKILSVVIVGRPNVGKSTLFNRLIGEERSIVHDMPGTTRDTIDTVVETQLGSWILPEYAANPV